jgi:hypothetical protein
MQKPQIERTPWTIMTEGDLEALANMKAFLDEQQRERDEYLAFLRSVWDDALDATNHPLFARDPTKDGK